MARKFFGTDGIRGSANSYPMTSEVALKVGMAAGKVFTNGSYRHRVVIGKDTRLSGYMIESALVSGFTAMGMDVFQLGPMPTPAVAMLTRSLRADLGVMISASHNPFIDNGIKLFGPDGYKLSDETEEEIEKLMEGDLTELLAPPEKIGRATRIDSARERYIEFAKRTLPQESALRRHPGGDRLRQWRRLQGGAGSAVGARRRGHQDRRRSERSQHQQGLRVDGAAALIRKVQEVRADIGIALDGDADRVVIVDEKGCIIDGDQLMAVIAEFWLRRGRLAGGGVVATVMSNLGLERYLEDLGLGLTRTPVGDRYVVEHMRQHGYNVGGEQSGHIVLSDFSTTGDGLVTALADPGRGRPERQAGERGVQSLRAAAADPGECPLQERPAARQCGRAAGDQRRQVEARQGRTPGHPSFGHGAGDSGHGRGRRRGAGKDRGFGHRPRPVGCRRGLGCGFPAI